MEERAYRYNEIVKQVLAINSVDAIDDASAEKISRRTFQRAVRELYALGRKDLGDQLEHKHVVPVQRGTPAPKIGQSRRYRVQNSDGAPSVRVPVAVLNGKPGDLIEVVFSETGFTGVRVEGDKGAIKAKRALMDPHGFVLLSGAWHAVDDKRRSACGTTVSTSAFAKFQPELPRGGPRCGKCMKRSTPDAWESA